ncbi:hypothetical protein [Aestuariivivens sediminicola]|uniref:hypothetical protein n=1 Tax=Aestuariivivens sediminicola TaxID=2913560 RepID=UPI001F5A2D40|nr:hypothetical protein [Aestuariivivens sediminicola]
MKKILSTLIMLGFFIYGFGQTNLYVNPAFESIAMNHEVIAIAPFKTQVKLRPKQMAEISTEQLHNLEKSEGEAIQRAMHSWFLKRKKRGSLLYIDLQDPRTTTSILSQNGIDYDNITEFSPQQLADLLNVDSIIMGEYETNKPMSEGASVVLGVLVGFFGTTNSATMNMSIYNGEDGILLWNYNKKVRGSIGSSPDDLINILMRKASRRMAYTKSDKDKSL